ncbi:MAG TPA: hypothetical protein EYP10_00375, partial [Armatimonadetes bacterium]|nr:hypothetical protein [Armatimonadota bacterium]
GIIASRIAAHSGDIAKGVKEAWQWDYDMSKARKALDWATMYEKALDSDRAREYRADVQDEERGVCTMCGEFCAIASSTAIERLLVDGAKGDLLIKLPAECPWLRS